MGRSAQVILASFRVLGVQCPGSVRRVRHAVSPPLTRAPFGGGGPSSFVRTERAPGPAVATLTALGFERGLAMRLGSGLLGAVLAALLGAGCGAGRGSAHELAPDAGVPVLDAGHSSAYAPTVEPPGPDGDSDDTDDVPFAAKRAACSFKQGALPKETFGPSIADGNFPIDTIVIVTQENRSFDEYLSQLPAAGQPDANVEDPNVSLSNATGQSYYPFHENAFC